MKLKKVSLFETIIALCIILDCESIWRWMHYSGYVRMGIFFCMFGSLIALIGRKGLKLRVKNTRFFAMLIAYLLIFLFFNIINNTSHTWDTVQFVIIIILLAFFCEDGNSAYNIMRRVSSIMAGLAIISLLFFLFGSVLHVMGANQPITIYVSDVPVIRQSYFYIHYEVQKETTFGMGFYRNTGIFYEGPKYALILSLSMMYELFLSKMGSMKRCIIFTITILTTLSMTGIYAVVLIWMLYILFKYPARNKWGFAVRAIFVLVLLVMGTQIINTVEDMIAVKSSTASYGTRMDNYIAGFIAWLEHIFMGSGYMNMTTIMSHYSSFRLNDVGYSNSIFRLLAQGGLYLFVMYLFPTTKAVVCGLTKKNSLIICYVLMFIYYFITTSFTYSYITLLILCLFWFSCNHHKNEAVLMEI